MGLTASRQLIDRYAAVFLPDAFSHMGRSAFGATAHDDVHGAVHNAFMTLSPYTRTSEDEVHSLGLGVRNCSHRALSDPLSEQSERIERACEATSAGGTARCASRGRIRPINEPNGTTSFVERTCIRDTKPYDLSPACWRSTSPSAYDISILCRRCSSH